MGRRMYFFNDCSAFLENAFLFGPIDHRNADTVLNGIARVQALHLRVNLRFYLVLFCYVVDPDKRCLADQGQYVLVIIHSLEVDAKSRNVGFYTDIILNPSVEWGKSISSELAFNAGLSGQSSVANGTRGSVQWRVRSVSPQARSSSGFESAGRASSGSTDRSA